MGKLNIAHHKSYHPYRRDNIEKVRRDEEEAREKEAKEEGRMMLADSEARIDRLRERAGSKKKRKDDDLEVLTAGESMQRAVLPTTDGHINFFEDLEHSAIATAIRTTTKKTEPVETERGFPLAPSAKDLKPWYTERAANPDEEVVDEKRKRDTARKSVHDPLTSITHQLASRHGSSPSFKSKSSYRPRPPAIPLNASRPPEVEARLTRESSERQRALDLIQRKQREMRGSETPSSVHGGGYGDLFNRREVEEAHRGRERGGGWGERDYRRTRW
ncbi:hypothetical protein DFH07DRAFT_927928 [Mycena maculata]|uniref:CBF1-interacting co-repressor CIR N-terminal domain-containing protein n=1 Tax=Mycena maculata TaxID=230809 RepID=A0AAD7I5V9_9AGAR|nr:hypothetical protein DFH07DRAFT_927928 [Mycena maculata]